MPGVPELLEALRRRSRSRIVRRAALVAAVPLMGAVAAFGISPSTVPEEPVVVSRVVENVALNPTVVATGSGEDTYWHEERIDRSDTFARLLARLHVQDRDAVRFLTTSSEARGLRRLIPGKTVRAQTDADGKLLELRYSTGLMVLTVKPHAGGFRIGEEVASLERRIVMRSAEIRTSLFAAIDTARLNDGIAAQLAEIFSTDIDFHKDIRPGDRFTVVYEMYFSGGEPVQWGRVLATEFVTGGKAHQAVWFQHASGQGDYYTLDGRSIHKAFLRSPLAYTRISSGFTEARFHPILQLWRAHRGIDYAAAPGSPVKATSDGVVESATYDRGYGNMVVLRHESKYTTLYGHLSGFGVGIRRGTKVSQGQVVGYVGSTGLATGPHLHYEFRINDVHQDPLTVALSEAPPITADLRPEFDTVARTMTQRLGLLRQTKLARLN